jgi:hypothetical protein
MAREKPNVWQCGHHYPIEVAPMGDGERAKCLGCGACGPVRADAEAAMQALMDEGRHREARYRGEVGA